MPRLFLGNFDFEHHLAQRGYQTSARLQRLNAELATSWLAIAEDGDCLWCPEPIPPSFFEEVAVQGLSRVFSVADRCEAPADFEVVPWGWTDALIQWARMQRRPFTAPPAQVVSEGNARQFSFDLETEWRIGLPGATAVKDISELEAALRQAAEISPRAAIKANWGMSGRERILVDGPLSESAQAWVRHRLTQQGVVFIEPWVQKLEELGIQIQIPECGSPQLIGTTSLLCDDRGQYCGSWFTDPSDAGADFHSRWQPAVDAALRAAVRLQDRFYFGPVGIDAMRYQLPDGSNHLRPLQDINARWTMGRLSLGWRRLLPAGKRGFWWNYSRDDSSEMLLKHASSFQSLRTSPERMGNRLARHGSIVWFVTPDRED